MTYRNRGRLQQFRPCFRCSLTCSFWFSFFFNDGWNYISILCIDGNAADPTKDEFWIVSGACPEVMPMGAAIVHRVCNYDKVVGFCYA